MNGDFLNIEFLSLLLGMIYFFTSLYLLSQTHPSKSEPENPLRTAVLIAMRNEQESIAACLHSLAAQNYPVRLFDVFVLDDASGDRSVERAREVILEHKNFHLLEIREEKYGLKGKMNALSQALEQVEHDIILITDADCVVPPNWIRSHLSYFGADTGMVGGLTSLTPPAGMEASTYTASFFGKIQTLDWLYLQTIAAASSQAGKPVTILGNNFGFRKEAYDAIGGFKRLGFSVTEDYLLMKTILEKTSWKVRHTMDPESTIFSKPLNNFSAFFQQRLRWTRGGRGARPWAYFITGLSLAAHLVMTAVFFLQSWKITAAAGIGLVLGMDYFIIKKGLRIIGRKHLRAYFLPFELFYIFYLILFSVITFIPQKIRWKGRKL